LCICFIVEIVTAPGAASVSASSKKGKNKRTLEEADLSESDDVDDDIDVDDEEGEDLVDIDEEGDELVDIDEEDEVPATVEPKVASKSNSKKKAVAAKPVAPVKKPGKKAKKVAATSDWAVVDLNAPYDESEVRVQKQNDRKDQQQERKKKKMNDNNKKVGGGGGCEEESGIDEGTTTANDDFSKEEWMKAGVRDPILKALREAKFDKPTAIQVRITLMNS
jgi:hypothetical protein